MCAEPTLAGETCGACLAHPPHYERIIAVAAYAYPFDRLIQSLKFSGNLPVAPLLADLMLPAIGSAPRPDVIVPMPLSAERLRERGFNQSLEVARLLGARLGIPVDAQSCVRLRHGDPQSALPFGRRADNVKNAFACITQLDGAHVAVVDDVVTTGATLNEVARVLRRSGADRVTGWMAARTLSNRT